MTPLFSKASISSMSLSALRISGSISVKYASSSSADILSYVGGSETVSDNTKEGVRRGACWSSISRKGTCVDEPERKIKLHTLIHELGQSFIALNGFIQFPLYNFRQPRYRLAMFETCSSQILFDSKYKCL